MALIFRPCIRNQSFSEEKQKLTLLTDCFFGRDAQEYRVYREKHPNT